MHEGNVNPVEVEFNEYLLWIIFFLLAEVRHMTFSFLKWKRSYLFLLLIVSS